MAADGGSKVATVNLRYVALLIVFPAVLLLIGTLGYVLLEGWPVEDALFMSVITVTTVGFGEVHPLSTGGRWFTMLLALGGVFSFFTVASSIIALAISGELRRIFSRFTMERKLEAMSGHVIVCGHGRMGRFVARALLGSELGVVAIDRAPVVDVPTTGGGVVVSLTGDAGSDELLHRAGILRARALVASLGNDADNVFLVLSARALNPKLFIVARAIEEATESKLARAGADRVVSPFSVGGYVAATAILHPTVLDTVDLTQRTGHLQVQIEEVVVAPTSSLCGRPLREARLREDVGVVLVAVRLANGETLFNPDESLSPQANDVIVSMGRREHLDRLERLASGRKS